MAHTDNNQRKSSAKVFKHVKRKIRECVLYFRYRSFLQKGFPYQIMSDDETLDYIIKNKCSISRFGDGELNMVFKYFDKSLRISKCFQNYDDALAKRLYDILKVENTGKKHLVCLPHLFRPEGMAERNNDAQFFWKRFLCRHMNRLPQFLSESYLYGDATISRFYLSKIRKENCPAYVSHLKQVWNQRNIYFVEGEFSRLGVGNDLFDNAASISRIICPSVNAFARYDEILDLIREMVPKDSLIILALGHTATVLSFDLSELGYQALDLGHIDVEYEWMLMGATEKVALDNKAVNEVGRNSSAGGHNDMDKVYESQIVARVI